MINEPQKLNLWDYVAYGLFWSWNLIFLAFMVFGFAPRLLPSLLLEVRTGTIPVNFLIFGLVLSIIPVIAVILGLTVLQRAPRRLFALGYVVEGPLMLLLAIRFFLIRQATPALTLIMTIAFLGMAAFVWYVLDPQIERRGRLAGYVRLVGLTLMLITSLYAALWIAFYALPITATAVDWIVRTLRDLPGFVRDFSFTIEDVIRQGLAWIPVILLGFTLLLYTASLFALAPIIVPFLSGRAWWRNLSAQVKSSGWLAPATLISLTLVLSAALFVIANRQPQKYAFALLESPPASEEEAQALLKKRESIRAGLLNAYLAPFRYISAMGEVRHVRQMYQSTFNLTPLRAYSVQQFYETVAQPLLYDPIHPQYPSNLQDNFALQREPQEAAQLYQRFFDTPIVEGERDEIVRAVRSTWSAEQAEAAWQAVDDREVHLIQQEVNVTEHGDWAEIELYEVYQNQTTDRQEVIYYFNLPESAVITGVWLGNSPDREQRFAYQVAPRGAAQAVYREQTRTMKDPALAEQIGPRQYRLRIFPVPPLRVTWDANGTRGLIEDAPPLYMWLTYRTLANQNAWPLPRLAFQRNVYWNDDTLRLVNGDPFETVEEDWLPEAVPASQPVEQVAHRVDFANGKSVLALPASQIQLPELPTGIRLAVVLDRSYSMSVHSNQVASTLNQLKELLGPDTPIDVYLTSSPYRGEAPSRVSSDEFDARQVVYFGGQNAAELLVQFEELREGRGYDAVLVLTDGSGYELGANEIDVPVPEAPIWIVHLDSDIPLGYDDQTLEAIQSSGGGVVGDLYQALARLSMSLAGVQGQEEAVMRDVLDGYVWSVLPTDQAGSESPGAITETDEDGFAALAARRLILAEMQKERGELDQLETLDWLHSLAQEYSIVTPYSSMIVLVTTGQQNLLNQLEQLSDRFEREHEALQDTVPATQTPLTGVPEPEEWLLISIAVALLLWFASRQRLARQLR